MKYLPQKEALRKEGSPPASQPSVEFWVYFYFLGSWRTRRGSACPPLFCLVVRHTICVYPPGSFPRVELTADPLFLGQER